MQKILLDAIIAARMTLRSAEGLMNEHNPARIDHDWEELSKKVESLPAGDLKYQLQFALFSFERDDRTQCYNAIHQAMLAMLEALYPQIIANPYLPTSPDQVQRVVDEMNRAIIPWSEEDKSYYLHPNWQEFADVQHLIKCYLDWTSKLHPHLPHLQPEDLLICLRVSIRVAEWLLGDYQNSNRFRQVREGRKDKFRAARHF